VQTSQAIVAETGAELHVDPRATEWGLGTRWAGVEWAQLPTTFPGELEAYLEHPTQLDFTPETIEAVALRMAELVGDIGASLPEGSVALVSHQDPVQALRLHLTGRSLADLQEDKPGHACVITLVSTENRWSEIDSWCPRQSETPFPPVGDREPS
jgi:broad specificity phosphatase PhoE